MISVPRSQRSERHAGLHRKSRHVRSRERILELGDRQNEVELAQLQRLFGAERRDVGVAVELVGAADEARRMVATDDLVHLHLGRVLAQGAVQGDDFGRHWRGRLGGGGEGEGEAGSHVAMDSRFVDSTETEDDKVIYKREGLR